MMTTQNTLRLGALGLLAAVALGCGSPTFEETVTVTPADVRGSVGGLVVDATTMDPLAGIAVVLRAGSTTVSATTDGAGVFTGSDLPAGGEILVEVSGASGGYTDAITSAWLPVSAGDVPLGNPAAAIGPIGLIPTDLSLTVQAVRDNGDPVSSSALYLTLGVEWVSMTGGLNIAVGTVTMTATTNGLGVAEFSDLPDVTLLPEPLPGQVTVSVPAQDLDGDGIPDFGGTTLTRDVRDLAGGLLIINVDSVSDALDIDSSNVGGLAGLTGVSMLEATDAVRIIFNQPVDAATLDVAITGEVGDEVVPVSFGGLAGADNILLVDPPPGSWDAGREYNVTVHAVSSAANPPRVLDVWGSFFSPSGATVSVTAARDGGNPSLIRLTWSEPVGVAAGSGWSMSGGNCPIYIEWDLDSNGDLFGVNEVNGTSCNVTLTGDEPNPYGPAGLSGFTTRASFWIPPGLDPAMPFVFNIFTSRISSTAGVLRATTGAVIPDIEDIMVN